MYTLQRLIAPGTQLSAAPATYFTATARTRIDALVVANSDATARSVSLWWLPEGGAAADAYLVVPPRTLLPGEAWTVYPLVGQTFALGDFLQAEASVADVVNIFASGLVMS